MAQSNVSTIGEQDEKPAEKTPAGWHKFWQKEMEAAQKRLSKFTKQGNSIVRRFLDERAAGEREGLEAYGSNYAMRLNLFHTNISTLQSMLYGSTPKIDVSREHQDPDDDIARVASMLFQRMLEAEVSSSGDDFSTALKANLQDRLLPGLGTSRVRYEFDTESRDVLDPETLDVVKAELLTGEYAPIDYVHWQDFLWGWSRTWTEVPWVSFRSWMTKTEVKDRFGAKIAKNLEYVNQMPTGSDKTEEATAQDQKNNIQKAEIWEFWNLDDKKVYWFSKGADLILDVKDDPLELDGFFPCPMPMMANLTSTQFVPRADFVISQDLYNEIDELQSRISTITRAIKVVGVYDKNAGDSVGRMLNEGVENNLIPVDNWAMFAEKGGLDGTIQWFPVQEVASTLQTLTGIRDQTIELLYQVTGMSDILRGANTDQYTSDGTNQLKAKFGSIRVQALQDDFARFAGDLEGLKAEVISKHFSPESIAKQSSAQFIPQADLDKVQPAIQLMQSPEIKWRVNIRPESIAMVDYAQLKAERTEYLTAMATFIQSANGAVQAVPGSLPILLEMMKWGMAGFKGANYLEGTFDQAIEMAQKAPPPGQDDGQQKAAEAKQQGEMAKIQAKLQADMQLLQAKAQGEQQKEQMDHQHKMEQQMAKNNGDTQKIMADLQADLKIIAAKLDADIQTEEAQSTFAAAEEELQHENNMTEIGADHAVSLAEKEKDGEMAARQDNGRDGTD